MRTECGCDVHLFGVLDIIPLMEHMYSDEVANSDELDLRSVKLLQ
jgi:hypothetical protein